MQKWMHRRVRAVTTQIVLQRHVLFYLESGYPAMSWYWVHRIENGIGYIEWKALRVDALSGQPAANKDVSLYINFGYYEEH